MKLALALVAIAAAIAVDASAQVEHITDFDSEIAVETSGDIIVSETIRVVVGDQEIKHGIYRDFPTVYHTWFGLKRRVAFDKLAVSRDGMSEPWHLQDGPNGQRVYIGSPDTFVPPGPHVYLLRYHTDRQLVQRPDFDELYWNVTGNQWTFPIDHVVAKVALPPGAKVSEINAYTGAFGERSQDWRADPTTQWAAEIATTRPLAVHEGVTISVKWQKGIVDANANHETWRDLVLDNEGLALSVCGILLVLLYYLGAWIHIGRDPPRGVIIPLYGPPKAFSPAAVRYLDGMGRFDDKSFAATIIDLAVSGALRIQRHADKTYSLKRRHGVDGLSLQPRKIYRALMGARTEIKVNNSEYVPFAAARAETLKALRGEIEKRYFVRNFGWWMAGLLLSLLPALFALNDSRDLAETFFIAIWLSIWSAGVISLISGAINSFRSRDFPPALFLLIFSIPFVGVWLFVVWTLIKETSLWVAGVFLVAFLINAVFHHLLKAPTREGRRVMDEIEGFRRYLSVGEKDRLNLENPPERTPEHYEKFLPYALALDVEQKWSAQFSAVLQTVEYEPKWYQGSGGVFYLSTGGFATSLGTSFSGAIGASSTSAASSASSSGTPGFSSGGGGGGFSGGGGGGGGGGGW